MIVLVFSLYMAQPSTQNSNSRVDLDFTSLTNQQLSSAVATSNEIAVHFGLSNEFSILTRSLSITPRSSTTTSSEIWPEMKIRCCDWPDLITCQVRYNNSMLGLKLLPTLRNDLSANSRLVRQGVCQLRYICNSSHMDPSSEMTSLTSWPI